MVKFSELGLKIKIEEKWRNGSGAAVENRRNNRNAAEISAMERLIEKPWMRRTVEREGE